MHIVIREFSENDLPSMIEIRNEVAENGIAFPQTEALNRTTWKEFFFSQSPAV